MADAKLKALELLIALNVVGLTPSKIIHSQEGVRVVFQDDIHHPRKQCLWHVSRRPKTEKSSAEQPGGLYISLFEQKHHRNQPKKQCHKILERFRAGI